MSYRSVPMCPADAMSSAASYLSREWGSEGYGIGLAGSVRYHDQIVYVFQCAASDGSRFLIYADRWGNVGQFADDEKRIASELDVEVS